MALPKTERISDRARVDEDYVLGDPTEVAALLDRYPFLVPLLTEARGRLVASFGREVPVVLEVSEDPEEGDRSLFARVQTELPPDAALARLDDFYDRWWLAALPAAGGFLHFDVE